MRVAAGCGLAGSHPLRVSLEHARISTPIGLHLQGSIAVGGSADEQQGEEEGSIALGMEEPADLSRLQVSATSDTGGRKPDAQGDKKRDVVASLYLSPWALPLESHWALPPCASTLSSCCQHADALAPGNKGLKRGGTAARRRKEQQRAGTCSATRQRIGFAGSMGWRHLGHLVCPWTQAPQNGCPLAHCVTVCERRRRFTSRHPPRPAVRRGHGESQYSLCVHESKAACTQRQRSSHLTPWLFYGTPRTRARPMLWMPVACPRQPAQPAQPAHVNGPRPRSLLLVSSFRAKKF